MVGRGFGDSPGSVGTGLREELGAGFDFRWSTLHDSREFLGGLYSHFVAYSYSCLN